MSPPAWAGLAILVAAGCHRIYEIRGDIVVLPSAVKKAGVPAFVCAGVGGSLDWSRVRGHVARASRDERATLLCGVPDREVGVPLSVSMYHGRLPNRAHVYAWLVPVPAAQRLCTGSESAHVVAVDYATLYALRLSQQTIGPRTVALPPTWPCHMNPTPDAPMDFAVTFDPDNRTWTEHSDGAIWIERRRLRIDAAGGHHR